MTQMLLFDSPATVGNSLPMPQGLVASPAARPSRVGPIDAGQIDAPPTDHSGQEHESGLHHMGDLARLVLLRYEMVAKRRAVLAARKRVAK